ncbi:FimB/Mfa2 family fimbrial subunit [Coprobacter tertius]|uniref:FimB/Mfa2 family fimbrial subunit n=1 Tax=Coprobacter tertius TaxID=2944915 RepID=A0ABT1MFX8_9BACT|nr:FimB/Mfa2 family fimbrial subunit [Coprobacter tertius]MCP9610929.1 FimB/Mfa2 family fimbrial subunit [Coprobacter tertius]
MKKISLAIIYIVWVGMMSGCIAEHLPPCDQGGLQLAFNYVSVLPAKVRSVDSGTRGLSVFIFDDQGVFTGRIDDENAVIDDSYRLRLPYTEGAYQFAVWVGLNNNYEITTPIPKVTRIENFKLKLNREIDNSVSVRPSLLHNGSYGVVKIEPGIEKTVSINLDQLTNNIRVIARGIDRDSGCNIVIEAGNGLYNYDGTSHDDVLLKYKPEYPFGEQSDEKVTADFTVMKLIPEKQSRLLIMDNTGKVFYSEDLIGTLLSANPKVNFTYDHEFVIEIIFDGNYPVSIFVNGWEVILEDEF